MLLNRIPFLDTGWIARVSSSNESRVIGDIQTMIGNNPLLNRKIVDIASLTIAMRCPLFVQLNLSTHGLTIIPICISNEITAYVPNEADISNTLPSGERLELKRYFDETTQAMLVNMNTLAMDGCDKFVAQTIAPISIYSELLVHGTLRAWMSYLRQGQLYKPLEDARLTIEGIIRAEWPEYQNL